MKRKYKNIVWLLVVAMLIGAFWVGVLIHDNMNYSKRIIALESSAIPNHNHDMTNYRTHRGFQLVAYVECEICGCLVRKDRAVVKKEIRQKGVVWGRVDGLSITKCDSMFFDGEVTFYPVGEDYIHHSYYCKHCQPIKEKWYPTEQQWNYQWDDMDSMTVPIDTILYWQDATTEIEL